MTDDPGTDARRAVSPARRRRRNAVDKLGFAHWTKRRIAVGAIHRLTLHENGGGDVVATRFDVGQKLVEQVPPPGPIPEMMVRIDDRQFRIDGRLTPAAEPILPNREIIAVGWRSSLLLSLLRSRPSDQ